MEPLRDPQYILSGGGVPWSLVMSLVMLIGGLVWVAAVLILNKRKEGKLFGSAKGDPYGISDYVKDTKDEVAYLNNVNMMCKIYPERYQPAPPKKTKKTQSNQSNGSDQQ